MRDMPRVVNPLNDHMCEGWHLDPLDDLVLPLRIQTRTKKRGDSHEY